MLNFFLNRSYIVSVNKTQAGQPISTQNNLHAQNSLFISTVLVHVIKDMLPYYSAFQKLLENYMQNQPNRELQNGPFWDFHRSSSSKILPKKGQLPITVTSWILRISKDWEAMTTLSNSFQCYYHSHSKKACPCVQLEFCMF